VRCINRRRTRRCAGRRSISRTPRRRGRIVGTRLIRRRSGGSVVRRVRRTRLVCRRGRSVVRRVRRLHWTAGLRSNHTRLWSLPLPLGCCRPLFRCALGRRGPLFCCCRSRCPFPLLLGLLRRSLPLYCQAAKAAKAKDDAQRYPHNRVLSSNLRQTHSQDFHFSLPTARTSI
jgi:hypothetical protein